MLGENWQGTGKQFRAQLTNSL